jgi:tetratricopeptide (TPR) repeat protein
MLRMARMQEDQIEDLDKAFDAYARVFNEDPTNDRVRDHLSRLANVLASTDRYAEILTEYTVANPDDASDSMLAVIHEAARLWAGSLRQPVKAVPLTPLSPLAVAPAPADQTVPLARLRAAIGRRMVDSKQQVPHFYVTHEYDVAALMELRKQVNAMLPDEEKVSVNDFIVKAVALTLRRLRLPAQPAAALTILLGLAWLTWPIWLAPALNESLAAALIRFHPLFALNAALPHLGLWTEHGALMYHLTTLGQHVPYALPNPAWTILFHILIAALLFGLIHRRDAEYAEKTLRRQIEPPMGHR